MGLSSFCSFDFVLFWANLDLAEFWLKSESGLRTISKVQMLLQQTFMLKKKYSKCQSRSFWTESRLAQEKTQNPTQLGFSHSLLFIGGGLSHKTALSLSCHEAWFKHEFVCEHFHPRAHDLIWFPRRRSCEKKNKWWFYIFDKRASTGELSHGENDVFVGWCHKQIVYIIILWVDSYEHVMWLENTQTLMRYSTSYLFIRLVTTARNDAAAMAQMIQQV